MKRVVRWALRLFPKSFRERYGEELADLLSSKATQTRQRHGRIGVVRLWAFQGIDLLRSAMSERRLERQRALQDRREGSHRFMFTHPQDIRHALRAFRRSPGFTTIAIITLALGIGSTTAIFSVVNGVLLKPLSFDDPETLVAVWHRVPSRGTDRFFQSVAMYLTYQEENRVFEANGTWTDRQLSITGHGEPERVDAIVLTEGVFHALRVQPILGRVFTEADMTVGTPYSVVLSYGYWKRAFGGDPNAVGQTITMNGVHAEVIGVLPRDFRFPKFDPEIYFPGRIPRENVTMGGGFGFEGIARLRPGVTLEQANRDLARILPLTVEKFPGRRFSLATLEEWGLAPNLIPLKQDVVGDVGAVLWVLMGTVGLVLLIACANVANLILVRAEGRRREVAVRTALGAAPGRIARQFLSESVLLGLFGGVVGLGLAYGGVRLLLRLASDDLPRAHEISVDPIVLLFTLGVSVMAGLVFGLFPVIHYGKPNLVTSLKEGSRGSGLGRTRYRIRNIFAISQVALALMLLIGSGLMIRSFQALRNVHPGFERPGEVLTLRLTIPRADVREPAEVALLHEQILDRMTHIPGVTSVGAVSAVTLDQRSPNYATFVEGFPTPDNQFPPSRRYKWIAGDYFGTMENRVLAGRVFTQNDIHSRARVVVVTENFAREYWDEPARAVGKRIRNNPNDPWREVIGVVGNVHDHGVDQEARAVVYWPLIVEHFDGSDVFVRRTMAFAIRTARLNPLSILPEVRQAVWSINPNLPLADVRTLDDILAESMARTAFTLIMLGIAAAVAVLLGTVGIYGVVSYIVAQRTNELGIRMALGANRADVHRLVLRNTGVVAAMGVALGVAAAIALTRFMSALLYGVRPADPVTFGAAAVLVTAVAFLASYVPARRAGGTDPMRALRLE